MATASISAHRTVLRHVRRRRPAQRHKRKPTLGEGPTSLASHSLHSQAKFSFRHRGHRTIHMLAIVQRVPRSQTRIIITMPRVNPGSEPVQPPHLAGGWTVADTQTQHIQPHRLAGEWTAEPPRLWTWARRMQKEGLRMPRSQRTSHRRELTGTLTKHRSGAGTWPSGQATL